VRLSVRCHSTKDVRALRDAPLQVYSMGDWGRLLVILLRRLALRVSLNENPVDGISLVGRGKVASKQKIPQSGSQVPSR
jgi:hypothetical protein